MAVTYSDKLLLGVAVVALAASAGVFGTLARRTASAAPPEVAEVELASTAYAPVIAAAEPVKTETWAPPRSQSRGREWMFDAFTPPEIFYNPRTKQFTVRPPTSLTDELDEVFGVELISVRPEPFRLQLIGYVGDEGNWHGTFENLLTGETFLAGVGRRLPNLALTVKSLEVRAEPVSLPQSMTTRQRVATAVILDEKNGREVSLTHRERKFTGTVLAMVQIAGQKAGREVGEGDTFKVGEATFRVERVQLAPPAIEVTKEGPALAQPDRRTLTPREGDELPGLGEEEGE
jgi:hypothetical protein